MVEKDHSNKSGITIFGLGFVGLTTALGFAHLGYNVYGLDVDTLRKETLRNGKLPFFEPQMEDILNEHLNKNFHILDDAAGAIESSSFIYYCVGTPYGTDGSADLSYLFSAIDETLAVITDDVFRVLVTKSTIPPSTTAEKIEPHVRSKGFSDKQIGVANNPEFLREGHCWEDFICADRIVIGVSDEHSKQMLTALYEPMNIPVQCVTQTTGEFIKYLSNTLLATMISYSNEMAEIADTIGGIEVGRAFHILHMDKRWNGCNMTSYVYPGCGYGGYCLPKDTNALLAQSKVKGFEPPILKNVIKTNERRSETIARRIAADLSKESTIGILGLSFKPLSDDVRDTAAAHIIRTLQSLGYHHIAAYDPKASEEFTKHYPDIPVNIRQSAKAVYDIADVVAIVTAWEEFKNVPSFGDKPLFDCRYMLS